MSNEEEDTCVSYVCALVAARMSYENMCPESVPVCVCVLCVFVQYTYTCTYGQALRTFSAINSYIRIFHTRARARTHTHVYRQAPARILSHQTTGESPIPFDNGGEKIDKVSAVHGG